MIPPDVMKQLMATVGKRHRDLWPCGWDSSSNASLNLADLATPRNSSPGLRGTRRTRSVGKFMESKTHQGWQEAYVSLEMTELVPL